MAAMRDTEPHVGDAISDEDYVAIVAFVLRQNGLQSGGAPLATDAAELAAIGIRQ